MWAAVAVAVERWYHVAYELASFWTPGGDFLYFVQAGTLVAAGKSPYGLAQYVYPPPVAWALAPFDGASIEREWLVWLGVMLFTMLCAAAVFAWMESPGLPRWAWPLPFALAAFTLLDPSFYPAARDLYLGQTDVFVLPCILLSAAAARRSAHLWRGAWLALGALLKIWPAAIALAVVQRGGSGRWRALIAFAATGLLLPISVVVAGGLTGPGALRANIDHASHQPLLVSDSISSVTSMLFTHSGLARPVLVSPALHAATWWGMTLVMLAVTVVALLTRGDPAMCTFNVTFCVVVLMPLSHRQYALLALPVLWLWVVRLVRSGRGRGVAIFAVLVMAGWWLVQDHTWQYTGDNTHLSALQYVMPFFADIAAVTLSVVAEAVYERLRRGRGAGPSDLAVTGEPDQRDELADGPRAPGRPAALPA
ncbi:MAG: glycosyltransferase family 87 protein [Actinomycetota bacterium]|nr:glycosyltransferase family 87 protein [Actinomycetota bacterium]